MTPTDFVERLEGVRQTGPSRWLARCPAHGDRSPSLSVREGDDGKLLLHCFAGCHPGAVVESMGLSLADLFPAREHRHQPGRPRRIPAGDILAAVALEIEVAAIGVGTIVRGGTLPPAEIDRLMLAYHRLSAAAQEARAHE